MVDLPLRSWLPRSRSTVNPGASRPGIRHIERDEGRFGAGVFSIDGSVRIEAADHAERERLLRPCPRPTFALDQLRKLDREHLIYDPPQPGPSGYGPRRPTPLELLDHLAAHVPPPGHYRYLSGLARPAAQGKFPRRV